MVNRFKAWFLRWLGVVPRTEFSELRTAYNTFVMAANASMETSEATIASLIQEIHSLKTSIPVPVTQDIKQPVRTYRNFREFRTHAEKPILIERKS